MSTRNLSKTLNKTKINGQRLPPIPVANESSIAASTAQPEHPPSILKKTRNRTEDEIPTDPLDEDDFECSRVIFQKSDTDILLLLDTYPPKTWSVPKCLKTNLDPNLSQTRPLPNSVTDTLFTSDEKHENLIDTFPAPLSDRLPSSRYCRRSVSSACSRRSSILFPRHPTTIPFDGSQLKREDTFDTVCESLAETLRASYTPLPPISTDSSTHPIRPLSKSFTEQRSLSPPLIVTQENPTIQEKKEEFTRRLLAKNLPREKPMESPIVTSRSNPNVKPLVAPRVQKVTINETQRRNPSVERTNNVPVAAVSAAVAPTTANRTLKPTAAPTTVNNPTANSIVRSPKFSLDLFQPQSKSITTTTKKVTKAKPTTKITPIKVKGNANTQEQETMASQSDVIARVSESVVETATATATEPIENPPLDQSQELKRSHSCRRTSAHFAPRCLHPVPKPLTLQGEKTVDADYPQTITRPIPCTQRRGSLKGQPVIMELFEDTTVEPAKTAACQIESTAMNQIASVKVKKQRPNFVKSAKPKKNVTKGKATVPTATKVKAKTMPIETKSDEKKIIVGGTDWMMAVPAQLMPVEDPLLSSLFDAPTVDDEELPSCTSPIDPLNISQCTMVTNTDEVQHDLQRRNSIESSQAVEISPVLTQMIDSTPMPIKSHESPLINSDIRAVYENVQDSIRKDTSLRSSIHSPSHERETTAAKTSLPTSTTNTSSSNPKTLPFDASASATRTYDHSESLSIRPPFRVVNDSLNSRGSETIGSTESQEEFNSIPLCTEADCDEIYRTARKGRQVGRGAYGVVWSYLTITGRVIAVKEIELEENDSDKVRDDYESVREEVNILRALNHPYIVKFLGITLEHTRLIKIYMEYLPNGTIENLLASFGPFHNDILKKYTRQIVEGVAYLHDNGVVHRDIKGKNIMLDVDGNIKLIDFGCAKRLKKNQNTHSMRHLLKSMKGTANWMAPEVIAETGHGKKADIWSIGCTLCEMATGKPPWSSEHNHLAVLLIIANGTKPPADLPSTCPISAQEFFRLCLTRDPKQRPSARELLTHPFLAS